ncbi:hypothetical protein JW921_01030, partial [Candidatus Fermentibacterales bacterium]|nr:hypothetical protein [Candidatus Fermentibacterales bacterium]
LVWSGAPEQIGTTVKTIADREGLRLVIAPPTVEIDTDTKGIYRRANASLVLAAARLLWNGPAEALERAFGEAAGRASMPGRLDLRTGSPSVLFDVAHNPQAMQGLVARLRELPDRPPGVIGFLCDKPYERMARMLRGRLSPIVTTTPDMPERKLDAEDLGRVFASLGCNTTSRPSIPDAVELGRSLASDLLVVAGSFYVVGSAMLECWRRGWLPPPTGDEAQALESEH